MDNADKKKVSWNRKARLKRFEVEGEMTHFTRTARNPAAIADEDVEQQSTRHRQVTEFENKYRGGNPCEVREELVAAFNVLGGLRKTIEVHKRMYQTRGIKDEADTEIERDLIAEFRTARAKAFELLARCGFPKPLSFGKRLRKIRHILSSEKRKKADAILALLED